MLKQKSIKQRGKVRLSNYFQEFKEGERVSVVSELSFNPKFPKTLQGRSGVIKGKQGESYIIKIKDMAREKLYIIHPIHLKRLQTV